MQDMRLISIRQDAFGNSIGINIDEDLEIWQNRFQEADTQEKKNTRSTAQKSFNINDIHVDNYSEFLNLFLYLKFYSFLVSLKLNVFCFQSLKAGDTIQNKVL